MLRTPGEQPTNAVGILQPKPRVAQRTLGYDADHPRETRPEFPENPVGVLQMGSKQTDTPKYRLLTPHSAATSLRLLAAYDDDHIKPCSATS